MNIPCQDCICFALCNSKVKHMEGVYKSQFIIQRIEQHCSLLYNWERKEIEGTYDSYKYITNVRLEYFCRFFNIQLDNKPDYNLLRHLHNETQSM